MRIAVVGGGGWGLSLAMLLAGNSHQVLVWEHDPRFLRSLQDTHANPLLLPAVILPDSVAFTGSFADIAAYSPQIIILATPSQFLRATLRSIPETEQNALWKSPELLAVVNVAKGIEERSLQTLDAVICEELPKELHPKICALSGPSHAEEVARQIPTAVVVAGPDDHLLKLLQKVFSNSFFRVYRSSDLLGVEIGGAVKNIIAIAAGIIRGLGFGDNTIGALLTRGIVEIQRFGVALGANPETFLGLSGIGDLITTATSVHSRNRFVGEELGKGRLLKEIIPAMNMVAEGVATTNSVYKLAQDKKIDMPIVSEVFQILNMDKSPRQAMIDLMTRELKAE